MGGSFSITMNPSGEVIFGNIADAPGGQCFDLTAPYEEKLGVAERLEVLEGAQTVNTRVKEHA